MSQHFSPRFRKAFELVQQVAAESGEESARLVFRDQMLKLGHEERVRNLYRVSSKLTNRAEFFVPNSPQEKFLQTRTGRDIVLKCRQIGFTTLSAIRGLDYTLWEPNSKCGIMAHAQISVTTIFNDIVKFSYNHFLRDWGHLYRPVEKSSSRTELGFTEDGHGRSLESSMRVLFDFRGKTLNFLHVSEASRVEDDRLLGSLQGVPANGQVVYESTPQGRAGDFFRQWQNWRRMTTLAPYRGHFVPWYEFYPEAAGQEWQLPEGSFLTPYERGLIESAGLTESHIAWRRWCIEANCQGDPEKFENEYPSNDTDCFFTGDALVFASSILKAQSKNAKPPTKVGFLLTEGSGRQVFHDDAKGVVAVWSEPDPTGAYVIGADPSGGVGKDRGAAYVVNQINGQIVARLWGQFDPADFATELIKLGTYFNKAWICAEANNHGHLVTHVLATKGYRNLYKRRVIDEITQKPGTKVGFLTTNESKMMVTERLKTWLKSGKLTVTDPDLIDELSAFTQVASKTGRSIRREASPGAHDDLVMAAAFATEMAESRPVSNANEPLTAPLPDEVGNADFETGF